ncbi:uncharacterized protein LOC114535066 [Dendronephthya gigantea]|uniref:uncharacterized protein LOC114535066 n=1 Tax=Dendronephthya gigantea TaxID=151771 RepID=UPI00106D6FE1|nr:uncharacterized protein LOC114535066 [Dendronephthya gigantea]
MRILKRIRVTGPGYDDSTLCNDTILCLHSVQSGGKVHGRLNWGKGKDILIPLDCRTKVEIRPSNLKDVYERVEELCSVSPKCVRVSQGCYSEASGEVLVEVGDKLHLKGVNKKQDTLICFDQHRHKIELPKDTVAGFQPLTDGKEYYLSDVVKKFKLPLNVQFVREIGEDRRSPNESPCQPYQALCLDRISKETVVTATTIHVNGKHNQIQLTCDLNVGLTVSEETFTASEEFPNLSKIFNQGREKTETNAYEYIDPATITRSRQSRVSKPPPDLPPKRPKATIPENIEGKTIVEATVEAEPNSIYQTMEERQDSECQKELPYTELGPRYASNHKYGELIVQQPTPSTKDQPENPAKPKSPEGAIALPILWKYLSLPPRNKRSENKTDLSRKARSLPPTPNTQSQNEYSIPGECPTISSPNSPPPFPPKTS